jgi:hypothetical protein
VRVDFSRRTVYLYENEVVVYVPVRDIYWMGFCRLLRPPPSISSCDDVVLVLWIEIHCRRYIDVLLVDDNLLQQT